MSATPADPTGALHLPVLLAESLEGLAVKSGGRYIDGTLGGGGHTEAILQASGPDGQVMGLDADPAAIRRVQERLSQAIGQGRLLLVHTAFERMAEVAERHAFAPVDGVLLDLGLSSFQLETPERGFAFAQDGPLDMRFDPTSGESASDLLDRLDETAIADLIFTYGEERMSRRIARLIVERRPIRTTAQLAALVEKAVGGRKGQRIHPATRTFQALRIAVNDELGQLERVLVQALALLKPGGRLAVISFHSLEDRIVKLWMREESRDYAPDPSSIYGRRERTPQLSVLTKRPLVASAEEIARNPRSRSAKLRIAEKP
ncbi:MAG: 16S rRNA (cytosine(1402)-N(4))-methyltransferase RsmH [Caldilineaceae bacterium]|nr:16S rRNA (cytosine(1402)-N(4))-methyltransferase RsmH [Caldilineaceae bacterium]